MRHFILLLCMLMPAIVVGQKHGQALADSLLTELDKTESDTGKIIILDRLSYEQRNINPKKGLAYARRASQLTKKTGWQRGQAMVYVETGINHSALTNLDSALYYYHLAIALYEQLKDQNGIAATYANMGSVCMQQGDYAKSLEYFFKALKTYEETGNKENEGSMLENIGIVYSRQDKHDKSLEYYEQAYEIYKQTGNKAAMARNLGNRGIIDDANGNYDDALEKHFAGMLINEELGNQYGAMINLSNIGYVYSHKQEYGKALEYQHKALASSRQLDSRSNIAVNLGNIGETYYLMAGQQGAAGKRDNVLKAIEYLEEAVELCKAINFSGPLTEFSKYLSDAYYMAGNYKAAYEAYREFDSMQDSIFSEESKLRIADMETKRELAIKEKDLQLKDKQITINNLELEKKRNERLIFVIGIALLLMAVAVIFRAMQNYRKSSIALSKEKQKHLAMIQQQVVRIRKQTDVLKEISHMQAHDIRGPVASILGLAQLFNFEDSSDPINKVVVEGITTSTQKLDAAVQEVIKRENESR